MRGLAILRAGTALPALPADAVEQRLRFGGIVGDAILDRDGVVVAGDPARQRSERDRAVPTEGRLQDGVAVDRMAESPSGKSGCTTYAS
ncbi:hypothetical protein D3272_26680 [Lichenibacterium ramalinae]|uniref:Uncharacterized protein n=1 Tax=Lichenibacterium ramalinae TaxID=2316527 RepID=A0A4Q2R6J9_9HYPH|nr:hypothetical protein D3272_26680 [Lichenibacterium ramalinae]